MLSIQSSLVVFIIVLIHGLLYPVNSKLVESVHNEIPGIALEGFLETETSFYTVSDLAVDQETANRVCKSRSAYLLSIEDSTEDNLVSENLKKLGLDIIWTSGVIFSNATVEELYIWSSSSEPFQYTNFYKEINKRETGSWKQRSVRNRRHAKDNCTLCPCPTTLPPFTIPPCKVPTCSVTLPDPPCEETKPPICEIADLPNCSVKSRTCAVDCKEPCRVKKQPVCTVKPSSKPRCHLVPDYKKCTTEKPNCTIIKPGACRAVKGNCTQDNSDTCKPVTKPCKQSCTERPCVSVTPPCVTTQEPCTTTVPITCPNATRPSCQRQCSNKYGKMCTKDAKDCNCQEVCHPATPIKDCQPATTCPPPSVTCPPPVTTCGRPIVDCSPKVCQSPVIICHSPKIHCRPPIIICEPATFDCKEPEVKCPEPEVVCLEPEVECSKPEVECPHALVHCDPIVTTCSSPVVSCGNPEMNCTEPSIVCEPPKTCPLPNPPPTSSSPSPGCCGDSCNNSPEPRRKRETPIPGAEYVEATKCVALRKDFGFKWNPQSCNMKYRFICEMKK